MRKIFIGVEYHTEDDNSTFEIFESISEAYTFAQGVEAIEVFVADFDKSLVYKEDDGTWNYDDRSYLFENYTPLTRYEQ